MADALPISGLPLKSTTADAADIVPIYDSLTGTTKGILVAKFNAASGGLISLKYTLTSAHILNCHTTPVTIITAPGAGYALKIESCAARLNFNTTAYAGGTNNSILCPSTNSNQQVVISYGNTISATSTKIGASILAQVTPNIIENDSIVFKNVGAAYTTGDSTLDLYLTYRIITL